MPLNNKPTETDYLSRQAEQANRNTSNIDVLDKRNRVSAWVPATLVNSFASVGAPYRNVAYRLVGDELQIGGRLDVTSATSGTIAFTISAGLLPIKDQILVIEVKNGSSFSIASAKISSTTGEVVVSWVFVTGTGNWQIPTLINSWENAGAPFDDIAYRQGPSGLEFKGHITGGSSGSIAFYLSAAWWPTKDLSTITDVVTATTPGAAQIYVAAADGAVTVTSVI